MREEASFRMLFEKVKASKRKLAIDDLELPSEMKNFESLWGRRSSCRICIYSWGALPPNFYSTEVLLWKSSGNGKTGFKSVAWRSFWSWTLAISLLFNNDLDKFKLETQIKTFKKIVDEKQVGIKEAIKIISSLNASRILLVSEVLKLVKLILLVPTTNAVSQRLHSLLCRVCIYCWFGF